MKMEKHDTTGKNEIPDTVAGWVKLVLKVVLYAAGLLMAGYGTAEACIM